MPNYREESKKKLSPFIEGLLPGYLKYEYDMFSSASNMSKFGRFIELFAEFLEKDNGSRLTDFQDHLKQRMVIGVLRMVLHFLKKGYQKNG